MKVDSDFYDFLDREIIGKEYFEYGLNENEFLEQSRIDCFLRAGEGTFYELHLSLN